jgi:monovalent cation/hydrogen antiporter
MPSIEIIVFLLLVIVIFSAIVEWLKFPQAIMLVLVGLVIGFTPQLPDMVLRPEAVFLVFLPPLLFTAARKLSWHDFKKEKRVVISLATGLVLFTTVSIAVVAHYVIPGFSWQMSFVLGAVISPPDAVSANSILKGLRINKRISTVLEGESLVNDASALVAYKYAIASVVTGTFVFWEAGLQFIWVAVAGVFIGLSIGWSLTFIHRYTRNNATIEVALTVVTPYVAYLLAEHFHLSGVLAVVAAGLFQAFKSPETFSYRARIQAYSFWDTIEFLLNGFVFILIGMQLPSILMDIERGSLLNALGYGVIITTVAILVRIIWVFPVAHSGFWSFGKKKKQEQGFEWRDVVIISWAGMRGVVSLASAMAIPLSLANGDAFPQRNLILFITFCVIFFTLVVHGLSLRLLVGYLKISPDPIKERQEENDIRKRIVMESLDFIDNNIANGTYADEVVTRLRSKYEVNLQLVTEDTDEEESVQSVLNNTLLQYATAQKEVLDFERGMIIKLHKEAAAGSDILKKLEHELDIEESRIGQQLKRVK